MKTRSITAAAIIVCLFPTSGQTHECAPSLEATGVSHARSVRQSIARTRQTNYLGRKLTLEEFRRLIKAAVANVRELQPFWAWMERKRPRLKDAYLGGGYLRRIMIFMNGYLRKNSAARLESRLRRGVSFSVLYDDVFHKDVDLVVPNAYEETHHISMSGPAPVDSKFREQVPEYASVSQYEVIPWRLYQETVRYGGTTLEKVLANPERILDPNGALAAAHQGRLEFLVVGEEEYWNDRAEEIFFTRTGDAIRYIRMLYENPHLRPDPDVLAALPTLVAEDRAPERIQELDYDSTRRKLRKLIHDVGTWNRTLRILFYLGIIENLETSGKGYYIGDWTLPSALGGETEWASLQRIARLIQRSGFTREEVGRILDIFHPHHINHNGLGWRGPEYVRRTLEEYLGWVEPR